MKHPQRRRNERDNETTSWKTCSNLVTQIKSTRMKTQKDKAKATGQFSLVVKLYALFVLKIPKKGKTNQQM